MIPPSLRLLIEASRPSRPDPSGRARSGGGIGLAVDGLDWDDVLARSRAEGLRPLLHRRLKDLGVVPPPAVDETLADAYRSVLRDNLARYGLLAALLRECRSRGVRVAVTKGARLAEEIYGDAGLRPFLDVDLLVPPADWPRFRAALASTGFEPSPADADAVDPARGRLRWLYAPCYARGTLTVEAHLSPLGLYAPLAREEAFWASLRDATVGGGPALVLPAAHELAYLCLHALQHSFERLGWLADVAALSASGRVDWAALARLGRVEGISAPVRHVLRIVNAVWPGTVPAAAVAALPAGGAERAVLELFWPAAKVAARSPLPSYPYYAPTLFALWRRRNPWAAVRALGAILSPPRAWVAATYRIPDRPWPMARHYLWRFAWPAEVFGRRVLGRSR